MPTTWQELSAKYGCSLAKVRYGSIKKKTRTTQQVYDIQDGDRIIEYYPANEDGETSHKTGIKLLRIVGSTKAPMRISMRKDMS
jgi:hypothetical protein